MPRKRKVEDAKNEEQKEGVQTRKRAKTTNTGKKETSKTKKSNVEKVVKKRVVKDSSSSESEWEDVAERPDTTVSQINTDDASTSKTIQITVNAPKTQKQLDVEGEIRRAIKRFKKEFQENLHKAHLLAFVAHGRWLSSACNDELNNAISLSLVPVGYTDIAKDAKFGKEQMKRFVKWFRSGFTLNNAIDGDSDSMSSNLILEVRCSLQDRVASNRKILVLCFATTVRALGLDCRIALNAHPCSRKPESQETGTTSLHKKSGEISHRQSSKPEEKTNEVNEDQKSRPKRAVKQEERKNDDVKKRTRSSSRTKAVAAKRSVKENSKSAEESAIDRSSSLENATAKEADQKPEADCDYLAEVYLESVEQWLCVDCVQGTVDDIEAARETLTSPIFYCLAFDRDLAMKDVTSRYSQDFMSTQTRRLRIQGDWLSKTFALFRSTKRLRNRLEDMQLEAQLTKQDMPSSLAEYKNHPLYVLKKDLKKFEGIYPADTKPVGFIRNEPVYPRSAVHMLHSKDQWRKEALVVKEDEAPYKVVKGRPKWNAASQEKVDDREVPLYGQWQTEPYKPKAAKDGIVPRNEYGNVELFKMSMLPPGTVHLELPGLLNVAKKMDLDCAPAMVGWEFHGRSSHPVLNGWVVCEEYKDVLTAAWEEEQEIAKRREAERRSNRALQNWRRLLRSMMIREKLQRKFKTGAAKKDVEISAGTKSDKSNEADAPMDPKPSTSNDNSLTRTSLAWPQCHREFTGNHEEEL